MKYPPDDKKIALATGSQTVNFRRIALPVVISDQETARSYCELAYHTYGRSEGSLKFETRALRDLTLKDLLRLKVGDPIALAFNTLDDQDLREKTTVERVRILLDLGYQLQVANVVAENYDRLDQLRRTLYTREVSFRFENRSGISVSVDAINFATPPPRERALLFDLGTMSSA